MPSPSATFVGRPLRDEEEVERLLRFLASVRRRDSRSDFPGPTDLREMLTLPDLRQTTRLWFDGAGELAAYALVDRTSNLWFDLTPRAWACRLADNLLEWGVAVRRSQSGGTSLAALDTNCRLTDRERVVWLESRGFRREPWSTLSFVRSFKETLTPPELPHGFTVRAVAGEDEVDALVALHREAHGTDVLTREERLSWMRVPDYERELDLVAVSPDGRLAAYCLCGVDREENAVTGHRRGHTDPIAVHPSFARRGLGRALLLTGMRLLADRGLKECILSTRSDNSRMIALAEGVGFRREVEKAWFSLALPALDARGAQRPPAASRP